MIYKEGQSADRVYIIQEGEFEVSRLLREVQKNALETDFLQILNDP